MVEAVAHARVDLARLVVVAHVLGEAGVVLRGIVISRRRIPAPGAPDVLAMRAALVGEAHDRVRPDDAARQPVADLDVREARRHALAVGEDPLVAELVDPGELLLRPALRAALVLAVDAAPVRLLDEVADSRRALLRDQRAVLVAVHGVAAREHRRPGERGVTDAVAVEAALLHELVAGAERGAVEPPLLAGEDQVRAGDVADAGGVAAVPVVPRDGEGLRRDDAAEARVARELLVPVDRVRVVECLHPAADVRRVAGIPHLGEHHGFADPLVDVAGVQFRFACRRHPFSPRRSSLRCRPRRTVGPPRRTAP